MQRKQLTSVETEPTLTETPSGSRPPRISSFSTTAGRALSSSAHHTAALTGGSSKGSSVNRITIFVAILASSIAAAPTQPVRPNRSLTPGVLMLEKNGTPVSLTKLCRTGYSKTARYVPQNEKRAVFEEYGIQQSGKFEVDHLISLELGGSNAIGNLWPQSYQTKPFNAHLKDALENRLHWLVCHGQLDLAVAQREISENWVKAYGKYITHGPKKGTR